MHIGNATTRDAIHKGAVAVNPTLIEQLVEFAIRYWFDDNILFLALHTYAHRFASLAVE